MLGSTGVDGTQLAFVGTTYEDISTGQGVVGGGSFVIRRLASSQYFVWKRLCFTDSTISTIVNHHQTTS